MVNLRDDKKNELNVVNLKQELTTMKSDFEVLHGALLVKKSTIRGQKCLKWGILLLFSSPFNALCNHKA